MPFAATGPSLYTSLAPSALYRRREDVRTSSDYFELEKTNFRELKKSEEGSSLLRFEAVFSVLEQELKKAAQCCDDWDSYGASAPSAQSVKAAEAFLDSAREQFLEPTTVVASAEGGIATYFMSGARTAYMEYRNTGEFILGMYGADQPVVQEGISDGSERLRSLFQIRDYLAS